jgi:hypothetical protein
VQNLNKHIQDVRRIAQLQAGPTTKSAKEENKPDNLNTLKDDD